MHYDDQLYKRHRNSNILMIDRDTHRSSQVQPRSATFLVVVSTCSTSCFVFCSYRNSTSWFRADTRLNLHCTRIASGPPGHSSGRGYRGNWVENKPNERADASQPRRGQRTRECDVAGRSSCSHRQFGLCSTCSCCSYCSTTGGRRRGQRPSSKKTTAPMASCPTGVQSLSQKTTRQSGEQFVSSFKS